MPLPDLLLSSPPPLSEQLRWRTDELRSRIVRANYNTQFTQTAPELTDFRHATAGLVDGMDDAVLSRSFRKTVPITNYDTYAPLLARFFEKPCEASAIANLFAPGLPDFLVDSSSTSGGVPKSFPYYNRLSKIRSESSNARSWVVSNPLRRHTTACLCYLGFGRMDVEDEDNCSIKTIYLTSGSVVGFRIHLNLDPEKDEEKMATFILDHAAPYAAGFIRKWRSFLLIHALFAVSSRSVETITTVFINAFVDMIRYLDGEFDTVVDCIANGTIPDLDGIADARHHLEVNIVADPERAAELRRIGRPSSRPGWCGRVWPNLRSVNAIASGSFASSVPMARWFLGPDTEIRTPGYGSTECWIGSPYNPLELNQFKLSNNDIIELLDISQNDSTVTALAQLWEAQLGRSYELVLTTQDDLWRYRLGDVVEICGFDPTDGIPVIQFVERRNIAIRFPSFMVAEKELRAAMSSVALSIPINVVNWTAAIDDRCIPVTIGFFVELASDPDTFPTGYQPPVSDLALAPTCLLDGLLQSNEEIASALARDLFRKPTIRVVRESTFSDFLQLKLDEGSNNTGQIKVPVILPKPAYVMWFANQVVREV
ncbi:GH3 auxin-responsive promoter [Boletus reticuloceps]|uniref:GH3 auxin-responsive promoter n=1 Tax=Boletus reticuloceps TaxID=495285 RepID=A0A8I2YK06_9AGAM|nr:GH3 auxin-responsive promoter [Boletus reticuloceps]